jgi:deoxycytidylate deaminase
MTPSEIMYSLISHANRHHRCPAKAVGACLVRDDLVVLSSVNGAPRGMELCEDAGCDWVPSGEAGAGRDHARHLHAEASLISAAANLGVRTKGADLYVTHAPCPSCALLIISAGFDRVVIPAHSVPDNWDRVHEALFGGGVWVERLAIFEEVL